MSNLNRKTLLEVRKSFMDSYFTFSSATYTKTSFDTILSQYEEAILNRLKELESSNESETPLKYSYFMLTLKLCKEITNYTVKLPKGELPQILLYQHHNLKKEVVIVNTLRISQDEYEKSESLKVAPGNFFYKTKSITKPKTLTNNPIEGDCN